MTHGKWDKINVLRAQLSPSPSFFLFFFFHVLTGTGPCHPVKWTVVGYGLTCTHAPLRLDGRASLRGYLVNEADMVGQIEWRLVALRELKRFVAEQS